MQVSYCDFPQALKVKIKEIAVATTYIFFKTNRLMSEVYLK